MQSKHWTNDGSATYQVTHKATLAFISDALRPHLFATLTL